MIKRIHIKNFRSIKDLEIETQALCALVGSNSTGKTNVLKAINVVLGDSYPTDRAFSKDDFHNRDTSHPIRIQIDFATPLEPVFLTARGAGKAECRCVSMVVSHTNDEGNSSTAFTCIDEAGREFYGNGQVRDQMSFIYIPSERALEKQLTISKWTLLGKILARVDAGFKSDAERTAAFETAMHVPREILEQDHEQGISYAKFKKAFIDRVISNTKGHANGCELGLEIYDPLWYYKMIQITTIEGERRFNIEEIGSGTQNLILLSLFQAYAELLKDKVILAIEEPELYLFPHAQRELYAEFVRLSRESQIFYTTHSAKFVNVSRADEIVLLRKTQGKTVKLNKGRLSDFLGQEQKAEMHLLTKFDAEVNELFFASKIILVEGDTEKNVLKHILVKLEGPDIRCHNFCVVNCRSKTAIPFFINVMHFLGHADYFVIYDSDLDPAKPEKHEIFNKQTHQILSLLDNPEENTLALEYCFEVHCGYEIEHGDKLTSALKWVSDVAVEDISSDFKKVCDFIKTPNRAGTPVVVIDEVLLAIDTHSSAVLN